MIVSLILYEILSFYGIIINEGVVFMDKMHSNAEDCFALAKYLKKKMFC